MSKKGERCAICDYMYTKIVRDEIDNKVTDVIHNCRRYAPRMFGGAGTGWAKWEWPKIEVYDWCGEFKEEK